MSQVLNSFSSNQISLKTAFGVCSQISNKKKSFFQRWLFPEFSKSSELDIIKGFSTLRKEGLLDKSNFAVMAGSGEPLFFAKILGLLKKSGLMSEEMAKAHVDKLLKIEELELFYNYLALSKVLEGIEGQKNFDAIVNHSSPLSMTAALAELSSHQLLTGSEGEKNRAALLASVLPNELANEIYTSHPPVAG